MACVPNETATRIHLHVLIKLPVSGCDASHVSPGSLIKETLMIGPLRVLTILNLGWALHFRTDMASAHGQFPDRI